MLIPLDAEKPEHCYTCAMPPSAKSSISVTKLESSCALSFKFSCHVMASYCKYAGAGT
jgi:hypothetical protein